MDCKLIAIDNGAVGRRSYGGNLRSSSLFRSLEIGEFSVPSDTELAGAALKVPFGILADKAYPSLPYLMRLYPKQILDSTRRALNYHLSRARRNVQCATGIMSSKWSILMKSIETNVSNGIHIVKAICILHNFVLQQESNELTEFIKNEMTRPGDKYCGQSQYRFSERAKGAREVFLQFFKGTGSVPWRNDYLLYSFKERSQFSSVIKVQSVNGTCMFISNNVK
jgi:hypothetical protein